MKHLASLMIIAILLVLSCNYKTERLAIYQVHGIDVSHYQSNIDWPTVANQNIHFAFVKATEGATIQDSMFCKNWNEAKAAGIIRGAYHFFRPTTSAIDQANNFLENTSIDFGDLPPVVDIEVLDNASTEMVVTRLNIWLDMVEKARGIRPIIYTSMNFYNKHLADHFSNYPIWIARYNTEQPMLAEKKDWKFWQYGNKGKIRGIQGDVDLNVFQGDLYDLSAITLSPFSGPATAATP